MIFYDGLIISSLYSIVKIRLIVLIFDGCLPQWLQSNIMGIFHFYAQTFTQFLYHKLIFFKF